MYVERKRAFCFSFPCKAPSFGPKKIGVVLQRISASGGGALYRDGVYARARSIGAKKAASAAHIGAEVTGPQLNGVPLTRGWYRHAPEYSNLCARRITRL